MWHAWWKRRNVYSVLVGKPKEKRKFGSPKCRWEDNNKIYLPKI
jgi:hypothetical protein